MTTPEQIKPHTLQEDTLSGTPPSTTSPSSGVYRFKKVMPTQPPPSSSTLPSNTLPLPGRPKRSYSMALMKQVGNDVLSVPAPLEFRRLLDRVLGGGQGGDNGRRRRFDALKVTENGWKRSLASLDNAETPEARFLLQVRSLLNKVILDNVEEVGRGVEELIEGCGGQTKIMMVFVKAVYEKSLKEANWLSVYMRLINRFDDMFYVEYLIYLCEKAFDALCSSLQPPQTSIMPTTTTTATPANTKKSNASNGNSGNGNNSNNNNNNSSNGDGENGEGDAIERAEKDLVSVTLIFAELYDLGRLNEEKAVRVMERLLIEGVADSEEARVLNARKTRAACRFAKRVGAKICAGSLREAFETTYFPAYVRLSKFANMEFRLKCEVLDVLDLYNNGWVPRKPITVDLHTRTNSSSLSLSSSTNTNTSTNSSGSLVAPVPWRHSSSSSSSFSSSTGTPGRKVSILRRPQSPHSRPQGSPSISPQIPSSSPPPPQRSPPPPSSSPSSQLRHYHNYQQQQPQQQQQRKRVLLEEPEKSSGRDAGSSAQQAGAAATTSTAPVLSKEVLEKAEREVGDTFEEFMEIRDYEEAATCIKLKVDASLAYRVVPWLLEHILLASSAGPRKAAAAGAGLLAHFREAGILRDADVVRGVEYFVEKKVEEIIVDAPLTFTAMPVLLSELIRDRPQLMSAILRIFRAHCMEKKYYTKLIRSFIQETITASSSPSSSSSNAKSNSNSNSNNSDTSNNSNSNGSASNSKAKSESAFEILSSIDLSLADLVYPSREAMAEDGLSGLRGLLEDLRIESLFATTADEELYDALFAIVNEKSSSSSSSSSQVVAWLEENKEAVEKDLETLTELVLAILSLKNLRVEDWEDVFRHYVAHGLNYHVIQQELVAFIRALDKAEASSPSKSDLFNFFVGVNFIPKDIEI